jgi:hypothetical protein
MGNVSNQDIRLAQNMFTSSATQQHPLGTRGYTDDGRAFRYVKAGGVALVAGNAIQSPAVVPGHLGLVAFTGGAAANTLQVTVTCASSVAAGLYAEGYLISATSAGVGYTYRINTHPAVSTGTAGTFTLYPDDPIQVATTAATTWHLLNMWNGVIQVPITTATGTVLGIAPYVIAVTQFGWIQTWGLCGALIDATGTMAVGATIYGVCTTSGEVGQPANITTATVLLNQPIGVMSMAGVDKTVGAVFLRSMP